ncbi:hypothetical protein, partial [Streptosporangium vulgare]|uniref:hypothetical protein n=1 Tax=Streptosporangium vulgare TaxID=46190 RepID=UPI0031E3BE83
MTLLVCNAGSGVLFFGGTSYAGLGFGAASRAPRAPCCRPGPARAGRADGRLLIVSYIAMSVPPPAG